MFMTMVARLMTMKMRMGRGGGGWARAGNEMGLGTLELCQGHDLSCSSHGNENGNVNDHVDWLIRQQGEGKVRGRDKQRVSSF